MTPAGFLDEHEFAKAIGLSIWGIRAWRKRAYGPLSVRIGRRVFYRSTDVAEFLANPSQGAQS